MRRSSFAFALAMTVAVGLVGAGPAAALPYQEGDVFAGVGSGQIEEYTPAGVLYQTLDTTSGSTYTTGMCFNGADNLYSTTFGAGMARFDNAGNVVTHPWGGPFNNDESCAVDLANNVFVGDASSNQIRKFDAGGTLLDTDTVQTTSRGTDWIDLAADQCTVFYTSEGDEVLRYNMCTDTQLPNFADGLNDSCFALRIRTNGEVLVACSQQVYRLSPAGAVLQSYPVSSFDPPAGFLFAMNVDPDGQTFWTGDINTGDIYRINITTGAQVTHFNSTPNTQLAGLAVMGEPTVGGPPQGQGEMVTKGRLTDSDDGAVDFAWRVDCTLANNNNTNKRPIEVRWAGNVFKKTTTTAVTCSNDPAIAYDPADADFDTIEFEATGRVNGVPGWTIDASKVTDEGAGAGNANDFTAFTITNPGGTEVINVSGRPMQPFPGSRQATGQNTATGG